MKYPILGIRSGSRVGFAVTSSLIVLALVCSVSAFRPGEHCGLSDPGTVRRLNLDAPAPIVPVSYMRKNEEVSTDPQTGRRLATYTYALDGGSYLTIDDAMSQGIARHIRVRVLWDVTAGTGDNDQCRAVGQIIQGSYSCVATDVFVPNTTVYDQAVSRTTWAATYLQNSIWVNPIVGNINLSGLQAAFPGIPSSVSNADLVIIMTARPSPGQPIAAYATCQQRDQHGRCTVGQFNWIPNVIDTDPDTMNLPPSTDSERHTAMHEIIHVLGLLNPYSSSTFVDSNGAVIDGHSASGVIWEVDNGEALVGSAAATHYNKPTSWVVTPRVKEAARAHFGCPTLKGMPLEDIPMSGGAGSHWEARVMGPEVMSYGTGSGETYLSNITIAFLEDTNQYRFDNDMGGRLIDEIAVTGQCNLTGSTAIVDFLFGNEMSSTTYIAPTPPPKSQPRWGRNAGCSFVTDSAINWPSRYICTTDNEYGCSYDNRMATVCVLRGDWALTSTESSRGDIRGGGGGGSCGSGGCPLPTMYQYFTDTQAQAIVGANADTTGGFSQAMDFAPVPVGYMNCQDVGVVSDSAINRQSEGTVGSTNLTSFGTETAVKETGQFGGQCKCPTCRCFVSSLMAITSPSFNPTFPRIGLCYKMNCYKPDYLQIAVVDPFVQKMFWYKCPPAGGKIYIPSFTGAFHCPNATEFCAFETVTGIKYTEFQAWQLWIILGVGLGIPFLIFVACLFPCLRDRMVRRLKACCGVNHFTKMVRVRYGEDKDDVDEVPVRVAPPKCVGYCLTILNAVVFVVAGVMVGGLAYWLYKKMISAGSSPVIAIAAFVFCLAFAGMAAGRKRARGISCVVITYFYATFFTIVILVYIAVTNMIVQSSLRDNVESNWDFFAAACKGHYSTSTNYDTQLDDCTAYLKDNMKYGVIGVFVIVGIFVLSMILAAVIMKARNVAAITFTVLTQCLIALGLVLIAAALLMTFSNALGALANLQSIVGPVIIAGGSFGAALIVYASVGLYGGFKHNNIALALYGIMSVGLLAACVYGAYYCFHREENAAQIAAELTPADLAELTVALTADQVRTQLKTFYRTMGAAAVALGFVMWIIIVSEMVFVYALQAAKLAAQGRAPLGGTLKAGASRQPQQQQLPPPDVEYGDYPPPGTGFDGNMTLAGAAGYDRPSQSRPSEVVLDGLPYPAQPAMAGNKGYGAQQQQQYPSRGTGTPASVPPPPSAPPATHSQALPTQLEPYAVAAHKRRSSHQQSRQGVAPQSHADAGYSYDEPSAPSQGGYPTDNGAAYPSLPPISRARDQAGYPSLPPKAV